MAWGGWKAHNGSEFIVRGCMIKTKSKHLKKTQVHLQREVSVVPFNKWYRASLVAQWLRVCLPMQGTRVRALVWEDPTCRGATGPMSHNY